MNDVYVTNDPSGLDYSTAAKFGTIVRLTEGPPDVFNPDALLEVLRAKLHTFNHEKDYIILSGSVVTAFLFALLLPELGPPFVRLLIWDSRKKLYTTRTVGIKR